MIAVPLHGPRRCRVRAPAHGARECGIAAVALVAVVVSGCVTGRSSPRPGAEAPRVILDAPTRVPIRIVQNITLVHATLNDVHRVTLIVDTGAQSTIVAPAVAKRLGVRLSADGPRRQVSVVGGGKLDIPFVKISSLRVGDARIEGMEIGVFDAAPSAHGVHGLLGADFLHQFRFTLDGVERWLRLEPLRRQAAERGASCVVRARDRTLTEPQYRSRAALGRACVVLEIPDSG